MTLSNFDLILAFTWPSVLCFCILQRRAGNEFLSWLTGYVMLWVFFAADVVNVIVWLHNRNWGEAGIWLVNLGVAIWALNRNWKSRHRKKAVDALGAKSRALREKLVEKMRDTMPHPAPVPVPVRA